MCSNAVLVNKIYQYRRLCSNPSPNIQDNRNPPLIPAAHAGADVGAGVGVGVGVDPGAGVGAGMSPEADVTFITSPATSLPPFPSSTVTTALYLPIVE